MAGQGLRPLPGVRKPARQILPAIVQIGEYARQLLQSRVRGIVLAPVSEAIYLRTEQQEILWLSSERAPMHRRGMRQSGPLVSARAGDPFRLAGSMLVLGEGQQLAWDQARVWHAPEIQPRRLAPPERLPDRLLDLCGGYRPQETDGFGVFIESLRAMAWPDRFEADTRRLNRVQRAAWPAIEAIFESCLKPDLARLLRHGERLIGLGTGLTPSGDDFIGGMLFAVHHLGQLYGGRHGISADGLRSWVEGLRSHTHPISHAILADHAAGFGAEELHDLLRSFLGQGRIGEALQAARRLDRIGDTTGTDLLTGAMAGILLMAEGGGAARLPEQAPPIPPAES